MLATCGILAPCASHGHKQIWVIRGMRRTLATLATLVMMVTCAAIRTMAAKERNASFAINQSMATLATIAKCRTMVTCASTLAYTCSLFRTLVRFRDTAPGG